ncbi:hypothetical protein CDAR_85871, partial [Caerostris darwini]
HQNTEETFKKNVLDLSGDLSEPSPSPNHRSCENSPYRLCTENWPLEKIIEPLDCRIFNVVTDFVPAVRKLDTSCDVLRSICYATINELYPEPQWLRIYTDGSRLEQEAGVFCDLYSVYTPVGRFASLTTVKLKLYVLS